MRDIPVIFSKPMVLALLAGQKTMTRRPSYVERKKEAGSNASVAVPSSWLKAKKGDRLWVRENLTCVGDGKWRYKADDKHVTLSAGDPRVSDMIAWAHHKEQSYAPSIHMPRWASRLTLVVVETKVERLHKISRADVLAEGIPPEEIKRWEHWFHPDDCPGEAFGVLWDSINGKDEWDKNPEVVALRFTAHMMNIDSMREAAA